MRINTKVVHEVRYGDLEKFVKETYGKKYCFVASQECGNDSSHSFNISEKEPLDEWDQGKLDLFLKNEKAETVYPSILLQDMVNRDLIPTGSYVVRVSW